MTLELKGDTIMNINPTAMTALIALLSLIVAVLTLMRNRRGDDQREAAKIALMDGKLDSIRSGVDDIRVEQKAVQRDISSLNERVARVEVEVDALKEGHK